MPFPIGDHFLPSLYPQLFSRHWTISMLGSRYWPFGVTWRHRDFGVTWRHRLHEHSINHRPFPICFLRDSFSV